MDTLDGLLGRRTLKERIETLEDERSRLESQLDAEEQRRRDAVRDRQSAEERVNQLEDRVAGLEGELQRERDEEVAASWTHVEAVGRRDAKSIVGLIESVRSTREGAFSAAVEEIPDAVGALFGEHTPLVERVAPCLVYADDRQLVRAVLDPPRLPDAYAAWDDRFRIDPSWFVPTGPAAFALARADLFAIGTYTDGELVYDHGFESDVMGRHGKGGFSQSRFERRRAEQVDEHVDRCRTALEKVDHEIILVGDRRIISRLSDRSIATDVVDASGAPADALDEAFDDFWTTRVYVP